MDRTERYQAINEVRRRETAGEPPGLHDPLSRRRASRRKALSWAFLVLVVAAFLAAGCLPPRLTPLRSEVRAAGTARITLQSVEADQFVFMVWNETAIPITVDRDSVVLVAPHVKRAWTKGTFSRRMVTVPAGGVHDVKMEFNLSDLKPGEQIEFDFSSALISQGRPVSIEPVTLRVEN